MKKSLSQKWRVRGALSAAIMLTLGIAPQAWAVDTTTDSQLRNAYAQEAATALSISTIERQLSQLSAESTRLTDEAAAAQAAAIDAQGKLLEAINDSQKAQQRADEAQEAVNKARSEMASVAQAMYRNSSSQLMGAYFVMGSDSLHEAAARDRVLSSVANARDEQVKNFEALEHRAETLQKQANAEAAATQDVADSAAAAQKEAQQALDTKEQQLQDADIQRAALVEQLAQQRGTTVALEARKQAEVEAQRRAEAEAAAQAKIAAARAAAERKAAQEAAAALAAQQKAAAQQAAAQAEAQAQQNTPSQPSTPSQPAPVAPKPSTPTVPTVSGGGAHAQIIVNSALSQVGINQDCTALVQNSLAAAGLINYLGYGPADLGTGIWQYDPYGTRVSPSAVQPGDVLIYGNASTGAHVAIYIGNGQAVHGGWMGYTTVVAAVGTGVTGAIRPH